jgi:hypothetical protein
MGPKLTALLADALAGPVATPARPQHDPGPEDIS